MNRVKKIARRWESQRDASLNVHFKNKAATNRRRNAARAAERKRNVQAVGVVVDSPIDYHAAMDRAMTDAPMREAEVRTIEEAEFRDLTITTDEGFPGSFVEEVTVVGDPPPLLDKYARSEVDRITAMNRDELVEVFKRWDLKGHSRKNKTELIHAILETWAADSGINYEAIKEYINA